MILIFDLDDTLYEERSFVLSGFQAVAQFGEQNWGIPAKPAFDKMMTIFTRSGRGRVFDDWLAIHGLRTRANIHTCVKVYRHHMPDIALSASHRALLNRLARHGPLFLVTDGHKIAQSLKVQALGLEQIFDRVYITHRYGKRHAKPSLRCFDLIRTRCKAEWHDIAYIGDNPAKDFVALNRVGATTIRVHTGWHRADVVEADHDALYHIDSLIDLEQLLVKIPPGLSRTNPWG